MASQIELTTRLSPWFVCLLFALSIPGHLSAQISVRDWSALNGIGGNPGDHNGSALTAGDFDGDGFVDLVIGIPDADGGSQIGRVQIFYGAQQGFSSISRFAPSFIDVDNQLGQRFAASLATGDFNGDGIDDLVIGMPGRLVNGEDNAGAVVVLYGDDGAFDFDSAEMFSQANLAGAVEAGDSFGYSLATGDLNGDDVDDLAIGVPLEDVASDGFGIRTDAGAVNIVYGELGVGLTTSGNQILHQEVPGVTLNVNDDDRFGEALAIADFSGDLQADLAVGVPGEFRGAADEAGAVEIFLGGPDGIDVFLTERILSQLDVTIQGSPDVDDKFGDTLATGDFDGNGRADLAVGVPGESEFLGVVEAGAVQVFYGFGSGLSTAGDEAFDKSSSAGPFQVNSFDRYGEALAAGDFNADGRDDLAIGVPFDNADGLVNSGSVTVLYGTTGGLTASLGRPIDLSFFVEAEAGDEFGFALAAPGLNSANAGADLIIGIPNRDALGIPQRGTALALFSQYIFVDELETGDTSRWGAVSP